MQALKAHVRDGRIVIDEATDLPEGTELVVEVERLRVFSPEADKDAEEIHRQWVASRAPTVLSWRCPQAGVVRTPICEFLCACPPEKRNEALTSQDARRTRPTRR
jgi:hypothetical protein